MQQNRSIDELGRIILPLDLRLELGIKEKDLLKIFTQDNKIIIEKTN